MPNGLLSRNRAENVMGGVERDSCAGGFNHAFRRARARITSRSRARWLRCSAFNTAGRLGWVCGCSGGCLPLSFNGAESRRSGLAGELHYIVLARSSAWRYACRIFSHGVLQAAWTRRCHPLDENPRSRASPSRTAHRWLTAGHAAASRMMCIRNGRNVTCRWRWAVTGDRTGETRLAFMSRLAVRAVDRASAPHAVGAVHELCADPWPGGSVIS